MEPKKALIEQIWQKENLAENIRAHCKVVEKASVDLANKLIAKGVKVNLEFVKFGALLHDIGRARDNSARHGITGYEILQNYPEVPEEIRKIAKYHVGAGFTKEEATALKIIPAEDLLPATVEEKIISYADNLVEGIDKIRSFEASLKDFEKRFGAESKIVERLKLQHAELEDFVSRDEMHEIERKAVEEGILIKDLMENAGKGVAELVAERYNVKGKKIFCFVGPGNNGGDALVAARHLKGLLADVEILLLAEPKTWEAKMNLKAAKTFLVPIREIKEKAELEKISGDIAIDGLFGTGIRGTLEEPIASAINTINKFPVKVAIDVPSGLLADGTETACMVKADFVITLHKFKRSLIGRYKLGQVVLIDIGIPKK